MEVVGISLGEDEAILTKFTRARKMAWPQIFYSTTDLSVLSSTYGLSGIPFVLVIGKDGNIAAVNPQGHIDAAVQAALAAR